MFGEPFQDENTLNYKRELKKQVSCTLWLFTLRYGCENLKVFCMCLISSDITLNAYIYLYM